MRTRACSSPATLASEPSDADTRPTRRTTTSSASAERSDASYRCVQRASLASTAFAAFSAKPPNDQVHRARATALNATDSLRGAGSGATASSAASCAVLSLQLTCDIAIAQSPALTHAHVVRRCQPTTLRRTLSSMQSQTSIACTRVAASQPSADVRPSGRAPPNSLASMTHDSRSRYREARDRTTACAVTATRSRMPARRRTRLRS